VSNFSSTGRRRRSDAERSRATVRDAAIELLGQRPQASIEEIAAAAGVARQTVYAHYPSRDHLLAAVVEHVTADVAAAFDGLDPGRGSAADALRSWLETAWRTVSRYPILLTSAVTATPGDEYERHRPISERLTQILERGRQSGELDDRPPISWLVSAIIGLGHAAGQEAAAGRMSLADAGEAFRDSALRLCVAPGKPAGSPGKAVRR
jgi:AcrR family transcriptional regulator